MRTPGPRRKKTMQATPKAQRRARLTKSLSAGNLFNPSNEYDHFHLLWGNMAKVMIILTLVNAGDRRLGDNFANSVFTGV